MTTDFDQGAVRVESGQIEKPLASRDFSPQKPSRYRLSAGFFFKNRCPMNIDLRIYGRITANKLRADLPRHIGSPILISNICLPYFGDLENLKKILADMGNF